VRQQTPIGLRCAQSWLAVWLIVAVPGCDWWGAEEPQDAHSPIPEFKTLVSDSQSAPVKRAQLDLKLNVGDRFPLLKTVEQSLTQQTLQGEKTSRSTLELSLAITVEEERGGHKRMGVRYDHVRYRQDIAGEQIEFDSQNPQEPLPTAVKAYAGLPGNGFSFWIGSDNQLIELVGFADFLKRCVKSVAPAQRQAVMIALQESAGDEGIANFVDDSIGLLPYRPEGNEHASTVRVGDRWERKRQVVRPIPMYLTTVYTLSELTDRTARIDIVGSISHSTTYGPSQQEQSNLSVTVTCGHSLGSCTIDRDTGLPLDSRVERYVEMTVQLPDGAKFDQQKRILTTMRAFPQQTSGEEILPVGAQSPQPSAANGPAHLSNAANVSSGR
jgi:hypothetical protein